MTTTDTTRTLVHVDPTTIVLDRQHRPAAVFLRAITAGELIDVVTRIEQE